MSTIGKILQLDLAREVFALPNRSMLEKFGIFIQSYISKIIHVCHRRILFSRGRKFGRQLEALAKSDQLEMVSCPLCGADSPEEGEDVWCGLHLRRCPQCSLRYISPRLSAEAVKKFYTENYYYEYRIWLGHPVKNEAQTDELLLGNKRFARAEMLIPPGSVLDIGCSTGEMLAASKERGWKTYGTDLNTYAVKYACEQRGLDVRQGPLSAETFPGEQFDLITMFDVIEHLPNPVEHMRLLKTLVKPTGMIFLTTPNAGCKEALKDFSKWKHLKPWEHICHYDSRTIQELGKRSGFELIDVDTELSSGVGYVGSLLAVLRPVDFEIPSDTKRIFVRADGARGDTLLATPILRGLLNRFTDTSLHVATKFPELLEGEERIETVPAETPAQEKISLRARYEVEPNDHVVDVMTRLCRAGDADRHIYYHVKKEEEEYAREKLASFSRPIITIHPLTGTRIKRWKEAYWKELADLFQEKKYTTVLVGSKDDTTGIPQSMDLRNSITLREAVAVVKVSDVFVGLDSFFAHAAGAVRTPRVVLFGSTDPDRLACDLDVCPTEILRGCCPHFGCRHDCLPDQWPRNIECRLGTVACMDTITPHVVCEAVDRLLSRNSQEET